MITKGRVNGPIFVELLKRLMHNAPRPIFLILDSGSFHRSRPVEEYVASLGGKLRLFFLPPYAPELNPDEQVWKYVKHHGVGRTALRGAHELKNFAAIRRAARQSLLITADGSFVRTLVESRHNMRTTTPPVRAGSEFLYGFGGS